MTFTRRDFAGLAAFAGAVAAGQPAWGQGASRRAEVEALRRRAETVHPRGREAAADPRWRARWDDLAAKADALSDGAYVVVTRRALGWFKDGHTNVRGFEATGVPPPLAKGPFSLSLPFQVRVFSDGAYVTGAKDEAASLLGARIDRIGALTTTELMRAWATDWPGSDAWAQRFASTMFAPAFLEALGAVKDPAAAVAIEGDLGGRSVSVLAKPRPDAKDGLQTLQRTKTRVEHWFDDAGDERNGNFVRREGEAVFISCDSLDRDIPSFEKFVRACFEALEDGAAGRVIVDLRRNGGGNNFLFEPLRKRIERSRFNRPGKLYVMISPMTFSAAQNATNRLERETFALFVGEPTGGAPNHYGDAQSETGEATGLMTFVSTLPWFDSYPMDKREWVAPDLPAPQLFADWRDGRDPALDIAMTHESDEPADEWSEARVFYFRRPSQSVAWRPFWRAG